MAKSAAKLFSHRKILAFNRICADSHKRSIVEKFKKAREGEIKAQEEKDDNQHD